MQEPTNMEHMRFLLWFVILYTVRARAVGNCFRALPIASPVLEELPWWRRFTP